MYTLQFTPENQPYTIYKNIMNLVKITSAPIIPFSEEIVETSEMGDGTTSYRHTGVLKDKTIEVPCNFVVKSKKEANERLYDIKKYFAGGKGLLKFPDEDPDHFRKVKNIKYNISERWHGFMFSFTIKFTVDGYRYIDKYSRPMQISVFDITSIINLYEPSYPTYKFYNTSEKTGWISIISLTHNRSFKIYQPFAKKYNYYQPGSIDNALAVKYIEINSENAYMKTVYENGYFEYTTLKTEGSFENLKIEYGSNDIVINTEIGLIRTEIFRNFKEI